MLDVWGRFNIFVFIFASVFVFLFASKLVFVFVFVRLLVAFESPACWMSGGDSIWLSAG